MAMPHEDNGLVRFLIRKFTPHEKVSERETQSHFTTLMKYKGWAIQFKNLTLINEELLHPKIVIY